jgi:hypothetical protein
MIKNMCIEQKNEKSVCIAQFIFLKNLPGEVETATWTDQDDLTCTEMKLGIDHE